MGALETSDCKTFFITNLIRDIFAMHGVSYDTREDVAQDHRSCASLEASSTEPDERLCKQG